MNGSEHNDEFNVSKLKMIEVKTKSNFSGGIQGGISNGEDIYFNVAFKPVSTIMKDQNSIDSVKIRYCNLSRVKEDMIHA